VGVLIPNPRIKMDQHWMYEDEVTYEGRGLMLMASERGAYSNAGEAV